MAYELVSTLSHTKKYKHFVSDIISYYAIKHNITNEQILEDPDWHTLIDYLPQGLANARTFFAVLFDTPEEEITVLVFEATDMPFDQVIVFSGLSRVPKNREYVLASAYLDPLFNDDGVTKFETTGEVLQNQLEHVRGDLTRLGLYTRDLILLANQVTIPDTSFVVGLLVS